MPWKIWQEERKISPLATVQNKVCYHNCIIEFAIRKLIINQNDEVYCKLRKKNLFSEIFVEKMIGQRMFRQCFSICYLFFVYMSSFVKYFFYLFIVLFLTKNFSFDYFFPVDQTFCFCCCSV